METATQDNAPMRATLLLVASAAIAVLALGVYGSVVFEGSSDGIASIVGEIFGSFVVALLVGFFVNKRRFSKNLFSVCVLIAVGAFWLNKSSIFIEALEAKESKSLLAQAKTPEDIIRVSREHPKNRFLAFMADLMAFRVEGEKIAAELLAPLDTANYIGCFERVTERNRQSLTRCRDHFVGMTGTISSARQRYDVHAVSRNEKVTKLVPDLLERYRFSDPSIMRGAERGIKSGIQNTEVLSKEYLSSLEKLNKACVDWFSFLVQRFDDYEVADKKILWANNSLLAQYNSLYDSVSKTYAALTSTIEKADAYNKQRFDNMTK